MPTPFSPRFRLWQAALTAALLTLNASAAQARVDFSIGLNLPLFIGGHAGGPAYGSVYGALPAGAVSLQIGGGRYWRHGGHYYRPWGPSWMIVAPPVVLGAPVYVQDTPRVAPPLPPQPSRSDPVIYPRNGQSAEQTEFDRQDCNRWATTQPAALADAGVFHRAVEACMDGRGYSMK